MVPDISLGVVLLILFLGLVRLLFFFVFSGSVSCEVLGLARFQGLRGWGSAFSLISFFIA